MVFGRDRPGGDSSLFGRTARVSSEIRLYGIGLQKVVTDLRAGRIDFVGRPQCRRPGARLLAGGNGFAPPVRLGEEGRLAADVATLGGCDSL